MKIKKGDNVIVISGKDKGNKGKVLEVFPDKDRVVVEGINLRKKYQRAKESGKEGKMVELPYPFHASNAMVWDEKAKKRSRIGSKLSAKGEKMRILKTSGAELKS